MDVNDGRQECRRSFLHGCGVLRLLALLGLLWAHPARAVAAPGVVISEIMYHPASEDIREEYLELQNGDSVPVDLGGWRLVTGVQFSFPHITLLPGGYLVVAADLDVFHRLHSEVTNVIGNWTGRLSNRADSVALVDGWGREVSRARYADDGDWSVRIRAEADCGHRGWMWQSQADGGGASLELVNRRLSAGFGQNWLASTVPGGTPGLPNSVAATNTAPLILDVAHVPLLPHSTNRVFVTARLVDEAEDTRGLEVWVHYRRDGSDTFQTAPLWDDGYHQDGAAQDGIYGAALPAQTHLAVVEFYLEARDAGGRRRTWPAPARNDRVEIQALNALYQVVDVTETSSEPVYRLILRTVDRAELEQINRNSPDPPYPFPPELQSYSQAEFSGTFISQDGQGLQARYCTSIRNRGNTSNSKLPQSYRVNFLNAQPWQDVTAINLNAQYSYLQVIGSVLYQHAGLPTQQSRPVLLRVNGLNQTPNGPPAYGHYAANEVANQEFAERHFPDDAGGNVYRCLKWTEPGADLSYLGALADPYRLHYFKRSNASEDDWTDLFALTRALDTAPSNSYVAEIEGVVNVPLWMRYFALETLVVNMETSLGNGHLGRGFGDDYFLYFGRRDPRAVVVAYDLDTILGQGDTPASSNEGLFRAMANPRIAQFMQNPKFAPIYYEELRRLLDRTFAPDTFASLVETAIGHFAPRTSIDGLNRFLAERRASLNAQIPQRLSIETGLPMVFGYYRSTNAWLTLNGRAHAARCRQVSINGQPAGWSAWEARWTSPALPLRPGLNQLLAEAQDEAGQVFERSPIDVWFDAGPLNPAPSLISADATWSPDAGPRLINGTLTVAAGATLRLAPGATIYFSPGAQWDIQGCLLAEGSPFEPIRLASVPGAAGRWQGLVLSGNGSRHRLVNVIVQGGGEGGPAILARNTRLELEHVTLTDTAPPLLEMQQCSFSVRQCVFAPTGGADLVRAFDLVAGGTALFDGNTFGAVTGPYDVLQVAGAQAGAPVLGVRNNEFAGSGDDLIDLRGVQALVEGNYFRGARRLDQNGPSACAVSASDLAGQPAHGVLVRNVAYDCDYLAEATGGSYLDVAHNSAAHIHRAVVSLDDPARRAEGITPGRGARLEANIFWPVSANVTGVLTNDPVFGSSALSLRYTLTSTADHAAAADANFLLDPAFLNGPLPPSSTEVLPADFTLRNNSPARGAGPDGLDLGALVPSGAAIAGEPPARTASSLARLKIGGPGIVQYRFKVNNGDYGKVCPVAEPLILQNLAPGTWQVYVIGRNFAGEWQDISQPTASRLWTVEAAGAPLSIRLNEILAWNVSGVPGVAGAPGLIELHNFGPEPVDLSGMQIADYSAWPTRFEIPPGTRLESGAYLVLSAGSPGALALPFQLNRLGDTVYLFDAPGRGGGLVDEASFGLQLPDRSIGRLPDNTWGLTIPTLGSLNRAQPVGDPRRLRINEWLAAPAVQFRADFVELYNPGDLPVDLTGLQLLAHSVARSGQPIIRALSYIGSRQTALFESADPVTLVALPWSEHLPDEQGAIGLFDPAGNPIDGVFYGPQVKDYSQGRCPDGSNRILMFRQPTPGLGNPDSPLDPQPSQGPGRLRINELLADAGEGVTAQGLASDWIEFFNPGTNALDLSNMSLSDDLTQPRKWVFAPGTRLDSGKYLVVDADPQLPPSETNTAFGLNSAGESLFLFAAPDAAPSGPLVDSVVFGLQVPGLAIGRVDAAGGGEWTLVQPSPGSPNLAIPLGNPDWLKINEWMARPAAGSDWLELFNPDPRPVALGGLGLSDDPARRDLSPIPPLSFVGAGARAWRLFQADDTPQRGADHVAFKLSADGDFIGLYDADGWQIDGLGFGPQPAGVAQGRVPDGGGTIEFFSRFPTPGSANLPDHGGLDRDHDGLPDLWETDHHLNPDNPLDVSLDPDRDLLTNGQEYLAGTDPGDPASRLGFVDCHWETNGFVLQFIALAGRTYAVHYCTDPRANGWQLLAVIGPLADSQTLTVRDPVTPGALRRYYRLLTPAPAESSSP